MHREKSVFVGSGGDGLKAGAPAQGLELAHRVFVGIFGVQAFAFLEDQALSRNRNHLIASHR